MSKRKSIDPHNILDLTKLKFFYGIPHCHSNISTGDATPLECLEIAYKNDLDFLILTDHNNDIDKSAKLADGKSSNWQYLLKTMNKFNKKNSNFIAIPGFEAHSSRFGHFNVINPSTYFVGDVENIAALSLWCLKDSNTIVSINHPHKQVESITFNSSINTLIKNIEVANGIFNKKYTKHDKIYYNMLDIGWRIGAINGQDNHKLNIGKEENLTCVISNELSTSSVIQAFKNHHVFSTESKTLKLYFTINSVFMGGVVSLSDCESLNFYIFAEDTERKISKLQIITNHSKILKEISDLEIHSLKYIYDQSINSDQSWYVIKVILDDKREAISSPIFLK